MDAIKHEQLGRSTHTSKVYIGLIIGSIVLGIIFIQVNLIAGLAFSILPIGLMLFVQMLKKPYRLLMALFVANYFIMGIARYVPIPSIGMSADAMLILSLAALVLYSFTHNVDWDNAKNGYTATTLIWLIYCSLQILNPYSSIQSWFTSVRFMAFYAFMIAILVPILFNKYKDLKIILFVWSVFTLLAIIKAYCQKVFGFDSSEWRWLYVEGKASTHILGTGIRYFSFFTDAANFGSGMGMSMVVFLIIGLNTKDIKWKIYYLFVGLAAGYGMMISGTRSAMIIPFVGFVFYILFSGKWQIITIGSVCVLLVFMFFKFTNIGQGNGEIRRMRSAFNAKKDASYNLRKENQKKINTYMADKPFGVGVGMGGGKGASNDPHSFSTQIATDSWMVVLRVETGIVGLLLYIALFLYVQLKGAYIVFFKIKDDQLRYLLGAFLAGIFGIMVSSYANEVIAQFPNGIIIFVCQAFIFMGLKFDQEISEQKLLKHTIPNG